MFARQPHHYPLLWPVFWQRITARRTQYAAPWSRTAAGLVEPRTRICTTHRDLESLLGRHDANVIWYGEEEPDPTDPHDPLFGADDPVTLDVLADSGELPWRVTDTDEPPSSPTVITFRR